MDNGGPHRARDSRADSYDHMVILSVKNAFLAIEAGLTTVRDLGSKPFLTVRDAITDGAIPGLRVLSCGAATAGGGQLPHKSMDVDTRGDMKKAVRYLFKGGVDCIKLFSYGGTTTPGPPLADLWAS